MRALAGRLEVKAPALYRHPSSEQELLDPMGTEPARRVTAALPALAETLTFTGALRGAAAVQSPCAGQPALPKRTDSSLRSPGM